MHGHTEGIKKDPEVVSKFERFDFVSLWKGREKVDQLEKHILSQFLSIVDSRRILEVGPGNGRMTGVIHRFADEYVATDINTSFLQELRHKFSTTKSLFVASNLYHLPFEDGSFSSAVMIRVFNFVSRPLNVLEEIHRTLAPGGFLIISISPTPSLSTLIDDLKYRSHPEAHGNDKGGKTTLTNLDMVPVHPASYPTFAFKRAFIRWLFETVGFNEIAKISCGLEDYSILRVLPLKSLFNMGIIFRDAPIFPTTIFLLQKNSGGGGPLKPLDDIVQCPSCGSKLNKLSPVDDIVCSNCGFAGSEKDGITDLIFVPKDAKVSREGEW